MRSGSVARQRRRVLRNIVGAVVLSILGAAPLAVGAVHRETQAALAIAISACTAVAIYLWRDRRWLLPRPVLWLVVGAFAFCSIQLVPLPHRLLEVLTPCTHEWYAFLLTSPGQDITSLGRWLPISLAPTESAVSLVRLVTYLLFFLLCTHLFRRRRSMRYPLLCLVLVAALSFGISLVHTLIGAERLLGLYEIRDRAAYPFMATFVNPNFQAGFYGMSGLVALGLSQSQRHRQRARLVLLAVAVAAFIGVGLSLSRGGMVLLPAALGLFWLLNRGRLRGRLHAVGLLVFLVAWVGSVLYLAASDVGRELLTLLPWDEHQGFAKLDLYSGGLRILGDFWPAGIGTGSYPTVLPHYAPQLANVATFLAVESEGLQLLVDYGLPAGLLLLVGVGWALVVPLARGGFGSTTSGVIAALFFILAQNQVDFSLQSPGCMLPCLVLVSHLWVRRLEKTKTEEERTRGWRRLPALVMMVLTVACLAGGVFAWRHRGDGLQKVRERVRLAPPGPGGEETFAQARLLFPTDYYVYVSSAAHLLDGGGELARTAFPRRLNQALFLNPRGKTAHVLAYRHLMAAGRRSQALLELNLALAYTTTKGERLGLLSRVRLEEMTLGELVRLASGPPDVAVDLMEHLLGRGRAELAYRTMVESGWTLAADALDGGDRLAARILLEAGRLDELRDHLEPHLEANSRSPWVHLYLVKAERKAGRMDRALRAARTGRRLVRAGTEASDLVREEAEILQQMGDLKGLNDLIRQGLGSSDLFHVLHYRRGLVLLQQGKVSEALANLRLAHSVRPDWTAPLWGMGRLWEKLGKWELALRAYEDILSINPEDARARGRIDATRRRQAGERLKGLEAGGEERD